MNRAQHIQELMDGVYVIQQKMLARNNPVSSLGKITFSQWRVLEIVSRLDGVTIKKIHTALGITSSAATQLVNELVKKKYVLRKTDPKDGRASSVTLTPKMKDFLKALKVEHLRKTLGLFEALNDQEFNQYIELNKKVIKNI